MRSRSGEGTCRNLKACLDGSAQSQHFCAPSLDLLTVGEVIPEFASSAHGDRQGRDGENQQWIAHAMPIPQTSITSSNFRHEKK